MRAVIRFLKGNYTALYREPEEILLQCRQALDKNLLAQLERVLHSNNPSNFQGHTTAEQRTENRAYGNHSSIAKNMHKVEKTMNKKERNKFVRVFLF